MRLDLIMPKLGDAASDCWVESWAKAVGDRVEIGELIRVVSIEKAAFDFESPYNGTLAEILAPDSVIVPAGAPIGRIDVDEELE